jgi:prophage regulatory protein
MRLLRIRQVLELTGLSRMTIYRMEREGRFPNRRRLGANSIAWLDEDVLAWMSSRPLVSKGAPHLSEARPTLRTSAQ